MSKNHKKNVTTGSSDKTKSNLDKDPAGKDKPVPPPIRVIIEGEKPR